MSALKFCGKCNNMLYPQEDKEMRTLHYACSACEHKEVATDTCVYKRVLRKSAGEPTDVLKDAATDPTLPRTRSVRCYNCGYPEAAYFLFCKMFLCAEVATDTCVYKRVLRKSAGEPTDVLKDAATDPTLPRTRSVRCYNCGYPEAAYFQAPTKGEQGLTLYFICCSPTCGHRWRD